MFRRMASLLVIYSILTISFSQPVLAQVQVPVNGTGPTTGRSPDSAPDFRNIIGQNERAYRNGTPVLDAKTLGKMNQTPPKPGLTKKEKTWIVLGIIGLAALLFVAIKYAKNCLKTDPANCVLGGEDPCTCTEYETKK